MKHTDVLKCLKIFLFAMIMICASGRCVSAVKRGMEKNMIMPTADMSLVSNIILDCYISTSC